MGRDRKDASANDIGTCSLGCDYWYGTLNMLANGAVTEIPYSHRALATWQWPPGVGVAASHSCPAIALAAILACDMRKGFSRCHLSHASSLSSARKSCSKSR